MKEYLNKEDYIYDFSDDWNRNHNKTKIINQYNNLLGEKVGELGSNSGYHCFIIAEFNKIKEVIGFDINQKSLDFGDNIIRNKFTKQINKKVKFKYSNLDEVNIENEYFDTLISFHTLEHIHPKDLNNVISEKYRILKKNGYVIVSLPYENAFPSHKHVNLFNEEKLKNVFEKYGFKTIECYKDSRMSDNPIQLCLTAIFKKQ